MKLNIVKYNFLISVIFLNCLSFQVMSQSDAFIRYSVEEGLPSSETYYTFQDSEGYMWFSTDAGVCRFDGYNFIVFDESDGLTDNTVFQICEDSKGRIWFGTFNCQLSYYENGRIYEFKHNDSITSFFDFTVAMNSFHIDSFDNIWMGFNSYGIFKIDTSGNIKQVFEHPEGIYNYQKLIKIENKYIRGSLISPIKVFNKNVKNVPVEHLKFKFQFEDNSKLISYSESVENDFFSNNLSNFFIQYNNAIYFSLKDSVVCLKEENKKIIVNKSKFRLIENEFVNSIFDDTEFLWFCFQNNGILKVKVENDTFVFKNHYLKNLSVSRVYRDRLNGLWVTSLDDGIFYLPSERIVNIGNIHSRVNTIEVDTLSGMIYIAYENGLIAKLSSENIYSSPDSFLFSDNASSALNFNYYTKSLNLGMIKGRKNYIYKDNKLHGLDSIKIKSSKAILNDGEYTYRVDANGMNVDKNNRTVLEDKDIIKGNFWGTSLLKYGKYVLVGTKNGLRLYSNKKITSPYKKNKYFSSSVTSLEKFKDQIVLIGTKSYGLLLMKNDSLIDIINTEKGLCSNLIRDIHVDNRNNIWIGSNKGLSKIVYQSVANYDVYNMSKIHGLSSNEITSVKSIGNMLFVANNSGLNMLDINIQKNKANINMLIKGFYINNQRYDYLKYQDLKYSQNHINIDFLALNYICDGKINYKYRMLGVDTIWINTTSTTVDFPTLPPSEYSFQVMAMNEDGVWTKPVSLSFTILKPFWFRWWFVFTVIFCLILLILIAIRNREKKINEKARLQTQIIDLELKSLRSQMNPHFIFNTLNTIQNAINTLDIRFASDYITRFGKLIRLVLESSKKNKVSFSTELEMLKLYIQLEAVRFSNKFSFNITRDYKIDGESCEIPSMVIQPFVENAILHGLTPKSGDNLVLNIDFKLVSDNILVCIVEDNGIGRRASEVLKRKKMISHSSMGIEITEQRLNLYFKETGNKFSFEVIDLKDENNLPSGTRVEIVFAI